MARTSGSIIGSKNQLGRRREQQFRELRQIEETAQGAPSGGEAAKEEHRPSGKSAIVSVGQRKGRREVFRLKLITTHRISRWPPHPMAGVPVGRP